MTLQKSYDAILRMHERVQRLEVEPQEARWIQSTAQALDAEAPQAGVARALAGAVDKGARGARSAGCELSGGLGRSCGDDKRAER